MCVMPLSKTFRFLYNRSDLPIVNNHLSLIEVSWEKCSPGYTYSKSDDEYTFHYIKSGSGTLILDHTTSYSLEAGHAFLIRPKQHVTYIASSEEPWEYFYFMFVGDMADKLVEETCFNNGNSIIKIKNDDIANLINKAASNIIFDNITEIESFNYLFNFLNCIRSYAYLPKRDYETSKKNKLLIKINEYISERYAEKILISEMADYFNMERSYFYRKFKEITGTSIENYIISFKINQAKKLIVQSNLPLTEIASSVGYSTYPSFYKAFKKIEKTSPQEFKKKFSQF